MSPPLWSYSDIEALKNFLKNINIPDLLASRPFMWQASCPFSFFNQNYCFVTNGLKGWSAKGLQKRVADKVYVPNIATACLCIFVNLYFHTEGCDKNQSFFWHLDVFQMQFWAYCIKTAFFTGPFLIIFQDIPEGETMRAARSLQFLEKTQVLTVQSWARKNV